MSKTRLIDDIRRVLEAHSDGRELVWGEEAEAVVSEYRPDGFSKETSPEGGRRHLAVEDALAELRRGDQFAQEIADRAARWFAFSIVDYPDLAPVEPEKRALVAEAHDNSWGPLSVTGGTTFPAEFKIRLPLEERDPFRGRFFRFVDGQKFVHLRGETPEQFAERYAVKLMVDAAELRRAAKEAGAGIVRPV